MWKKAVHKLICQMEKSKPGEFNIREYFNKALSPNINIQEWKH